MSIVGVNDPFFLGSAGIPIKVRREKWNLIQAVMKAAGGIPHTEINPFTSGLITKETAWKAMDKLVLLWREAYPEEAKKFWSSRAARAKFSGSGATKDKSMRLLISAPKGLAVLIRAVFPGQSQGGSEGRKFWHAFARRYPELRATEKV